jgi:hypothetical protein
MEAMHWRVPIEISRDNLEALVETSEVIIREKQNREAETPPPPFLRLAEVGIKRR